jgi:hypothetical protein
MYLIIKLIILIVLSYPVSNYLMTKGMTLDLSMPANTKRYKRLGYAFRIPIINMVIMFVYLFIMLHKFKRL